MDSTIFISSSTHLSYADNREKRNTSETGMYSAGKPEQIGQSDGFVAFQYIRCKHSENV